jgi:predicted ABC-type sugar transport system permease subunit
MGYLGRQQAQSNVGNANELSSLLGSMLGGQPKQNQNLITSLIDADGDGSVLDDVAGMVLGSKQKKGGIGGMLGGLFGK